MAIQKLAEYPGRVTSFRRLSVHRNEVEWPALEDSVVARSMKALTRAETWAALSWALRRVDRHSFLMLPSRMVRVSGMVASSPKADEARPVGRMLDGHIALVPVLGHSGANRVTYVDSLQSAVRALAGVGACGWVVDPRENTGAPVVRPRAAA